MNPAILIMDTVVLRSYSLSIPAFALVEQDAMLSIPAQGILALIERRIGAGSM